MLDFPATSWKNRWAIRSGPRLNELIVGPTALIGVARSWTPGQISAVGSGLRAPREQTAPLGKEEVASSILTGDDCGNQQYLFEGKRSEKGQGYPPA
jgi:hypothetical protein